MERAPVLVRFSWESQAELEVDYSAVFTDTVGSRNSAIEAVRVCPTALEKSYAGMESLARERITMRKDFQTGLELSLSRNRISVP